MKSCSFARSLKLWLSHFALTGILLLLSTAVHAVDAPRATAKASAPLASDLRAEARHGQIFLTWQENEAPAGTTLNVYVSSQPITTVASARRIGHHVELRSANDWWEDPAAFTKGAASGPPKGYRLQAGGERLDPSRGLFVHTITADANPLRYFAVTHSDPDGREHAEVAAGVNSTREGIKAAAAPVEAVWQREGAAPPVGAGRGKGLWLNLHGKSGVIRDSEYLLFGDATMGWREGLPFKFSVRVQGDEIIIRPTDRAWINRPFEEARDSGAKAIWTFWYGYNSKIYDRAAMADGVVTNYTERRLLWILEWVNRHYGTDRNRWYCSGGSMGGCGTISFAWRHPELFAALHAHVPIVSLTYLGSGSAHRLEPMTGFAPITQAVMTNENVPLLERMNSVSYVNAATADLPYLFVVNGRQDNSIPWQNNPPFYRALNQSAQGHAVFWDDGRHDTAGKNAPKDVAGWTRRFLRFRLDESFPAFTNTSANRNPGNGDPKDGDVIGWMNRGMDWRDIEDQTDHYAITLAADFPDIAYPVQTDVTLRRVQRFKPATGARLRVSVGKLPEFTIQVGADGRITLPRVVIPDQAGVRVVLRRT